MKLGHLTACERPKRAWKAQSHLLAKRCTKRHDNTIGGPPWPVEAPLSAPLQPKNPPFLLQTGAQRAFRRRIFASGFNKNRPRVLRSHVIPRFSLSSVLSSICNRGTRHRRKKYTMCGQARRYAPGCGMNRCFYLCLKVEELKRENLKLSYSHFKPQSAIFILYNVYYY